MITSSLNETVTQACARWRTPTAVALAVGIGSLIGVFLKASAAAPFGPALDGWLVALGGAILVTASLCILAANRLSLIGLAYAASVSTTVTLITLATNDVEDSWLIASQFSIVFFGFRLLPRVRTYCIAEMARQKGSRKCEVIGSQE